MAGEMFAAEGAHAMLGAMGAQFVANDLGDMSKQARQAKHYKENAAVDYSYQTRLQQENYANAVESLKNAGLNPALASGSSAQSFGGSSMPSGSERHVDAPNPQIGLMKDSQELMNTQKTLNASATGKNEEDAFLAHEQARKLKRDNDMADEKNLYFDRMAEPWLRSQLKQAEANGDEVRAATLSGLLEFLSPDENDSDYAWRPMVTPAITEALDKILESNTRASEYYANQLQIELQRQVALGQLNSKPNLKALINAPSREAAVAWKHIAKMNAEIESLDMTTELTDTEIDKFHAEIEALGHEMDKLDAQTKAMYSSDVKRYLESGDYFGAGLEVFKDLGSAGLMLALLRRGGKASPSSGSGEVVKAPPVIKKGVDGKPHITERTPAEAQEFWSDASRKVGETIKTEKYRKNVSEPFREQIEINKARGDFNRFYKKYKKEHSR